MTKLYKAKKESIVRRVMADIKVEDFDTQAREAMQVHFAKALPPSVQKLWDDNHNRGFVRTANVYSGCGGISVVVPWCSDWLHQEKAIEIVGQEAWDEFAAFCGKKRAQAESRRSVSQRLTAELSSVGTAAQFYERFPELAKYLPKQEEVRNLPQTTDVIAFLVESGLQLDEPE